MTGSDGNRSEIDPATFAHVPYPASWRGSIAGISTTMKPDETETTFSRNGEPPFGL